MPGETVKSEWLDFRELPDQNPLFLAYLYHFDQVDSLYSRAHLTLEDLKQRADLILSDSNRYPRERLVSLLLAFNEKMGASPPALHNIEKLKWPQTLAVVTGQQIGLFGGPAFSFYKAATAVRLARILEEEGYRAVPVFWLASDDSDFQEVRSTSFFDERGELLRVSSPRSGKEQEQMVGTIPLAPSVKSLEILEKQVIRDDFDRAAFEMLRDCYTRGHTFREGFAAWLASLFQDYGLILFDPLLTGYKQDLKSSIAAAIEGRRAILEALKVRRASLSEKGFDAQVQVEDSETCLFWLEGERREKLEYSGEEYRSKGRQALMFHESQLLEKLRESPEHFGPNVLLRPILQDHLFPTVVHVGGPAEVAYFSQIGAISHFWNVQVAVFPRVAMTIVDRKAQRLLKTYDLKVVDILTSTRHELSRRILERSNSGRILEEFKHLNKDLRGKSDALKKMIEPVDSSVAEMLERAEQKVFYQFDKVQKRLVDNYAVRNSHLERHLNYLFAHLYPEGKLQERVINFNQFLFEEGQDFVHRLIDEIRPFCASHQVIYM